MRAGILGALLFVAGCAAIDCAPRVGSEASVVWDAARARTIPITRYVPAAPFSCTPKRPCPVAFISAGYGLRHTDYSFIAQALTRSGYGVVAIEHDLPGDPPLRKTGAPSIVRLPMWQRGAQTLRIVSQQLARRYPGYDWADLTLIGHSNGGDLSALALQESPALAKTLITLDHRRYPLPRNAAIRILSLRASDFEADAGVLPALDEPSQHGLCIVNVAGARHNDMNDHGPLALQAQIAAHIVSFLAKGRCPSTDPK